MLDQITPIVLTLNEEPNIGRCLEGLRWARRVLVVDSGSRDATESIARLFPNVRWIEHGFRSYADQWRFAAEHSAVPTEWVLALDADYLLTQELEKELSRLEPAPDVAGFQVAFDFAVFGRILRSSLYPPLVALYRKDRARHVDDGHTFRLRLAGRVGRLQGRILHDDRKPLSAWLRAQQKYMALEAAKLRQTPWRQLSWADRVRKSVILGPPVTFLYCLLLRGLFLDGRAGLYYSLQRATAEAILSLQLLEGSLRREDVNG